MTETVYISLQSFEVGHSRPQRHHSPIEIAQDAQGWAKSSLRRSTRFYEYEEMKDLAGSRRISQDLAVNHNRSQQATACLTGHGSPYTPKARPFSFCAPPISVTFSDSTQSTEQTNPRLIADTGRRLTEVDPLRVLVSPVSPEL